MNLGSSDLAACRVIVRVSFQETVWEFWKDRTSQGGLSSIESLKNGDQQRIIDALLAALVEARGQLGGALQVADVVPYRGVAPAEMDHRIPVI